MKSKRFLALSMALCLLLALMAGCGGDTGADGEEATQAPTEAATEAPEPAETENSEQQPTEEPVAEGLQFPLTTEDDELTMFYYYPPWLTDITDDVANTGFFTQMKKLTGVTIDFTACSLFVVDETFNIMVVSGDYTDLVYGFAAYYGNGLDSAIDDGVIVPLDDYVSDGTMPNYATILESDSKLKLDAMTDNGHIGVAAQILSDDYMPNAGMVMRQDYLEAVNMESPETYDEWHDVLTAFKNELDLPAPLNIPYYGSIFGDYLGAGYGVSTYVQDSLNFYVVDNAVKLGAVEDGYGQWLTTMNQWYSEGLIWPDFMSATDVINYPADERVVRGDIGIWYCDIDTMGNYAALTEDPDFRVVGVADPVQNKGDVNHLRKYSDADANLVNPSNGIAITTECSNTVLAAQWLDAHYSPEGSLIVNYGGVEGETYNIVDGKPVLGDLVLNNPDMSFNWALSYYCAKNYAGIYEYSRLSDIHTEDQKNATAIWAKADSSYGYPVNAYMTAEENEEYARLSTDMVTYITENVTKFITGEKNIGEFESFRQTLLDMGAEDVIALKQAAYNRYLARG